MTVESMEESKVLYREGKANGKFPVQARGKTRYDWRLLLTQLLFRNIVLPNDLIAIVLIWLSAGLLQVKSRGDRSSKSAKDHTKEAD